MSHDAPTVEDLREPLAAKPLPAHEVHDAIFKEAFGVAIPIRILTPVNMRNDAEKTPLVVFVHAGGFSSGNPYAIPTWLPHLFLTKGWALASPAYRLIPNVSIYDQLDDIADAIRWLRTHWSDRLDMDNWMAASESAGTTLIGAALSIGKLSFSNPKAWIFGAGGVDFDVEAYNPRYPENLRPPHDHERFPRDPSKALVVTDWWTGRSEAEMLEAWGNPPHRFTGREEEQLCAYAELSNINPRPDGKMTKGDLPLLRELVRADLFPTEQSYRDEGRRLSAFHAIDAVDDVFPEVGVYLISGENDDSVPVEWTKAFEHKVIKKGWKCGSSYIKEAGHGAAGSRILRVSDHHEILQSNPL